MKFDKIPKFNLNNIFPSLSSKDLPKHIAIVMDGNRRWALRKGLSKNEGHRIGEISLLDVIAGAIEIGIKYISVYVFSTENWYRSANEISFLMNLNKIILKKRRKLLNSWGVRVFWSGSRTKLWKSVIKELILIEEETKNNKVCNLIMCINYGSKTELVEMVRKIAQGVIEKKITLSSINEKLLQKNLYQPTVPNVDLFLRTSGEQRISNFLLWQIAYAEFVFMDILWPDFRRKHLWLAVKKYIKRDRRYGKNH